MTRLRRLSKKLLLAAGSVLVACVATELVLRAAEPGPFSFLDHNPYVPSPVDKHVRHRAGFEGRWDATWYSIDSRGLRGREQDPTFAPGELRIACLGDSCTFGKGVLERDSWPRQLETLLRAAGQDANVWNLGINGGWGAVYAALLAEHAAALQPDVVVVGYNLNDFPNSIRDVDQQVFKERRARKWVSQGLRDALGRLAGYRKLRAMYYDLRKESDWAASDALAAASGPTPIEPEVWDRQREYLAAIRATAAEHGGRVMVFLFPYESQIHLDAYDTAPIEGLREVCADLGLPFIDVATEFRAAARKTDPPRQLFLSGDRYHPNARGYALVAGRVVDVLRSEGWLSSAPPTDDR